MMKKLLQPQEGQTPCEAPAAPGLAEEITTRLTTRRNPCSSDTSLSLRSREPREPRKLYPSVVHCLTKPRRAPLPSRCRCNLPFIQGTPQAAFTGAIHVCPSGRCLLLSLQGDRGEEFWRTKTAGGRRAHPFPENHGLLRVIAGEGSIAEEADKSASDPCWRSCGLTHQRAQHITPSIAGGRAVRCHDGPMRARFQVGNHGGQLVIRRR